VAVQPSLQAKQFRGAVVKLNAEFFAYGRYQANFLLQSRGLRLRFEEACEIG